MRFLRKRVLVVGASSGLGAAVARSFSKEGASLVLVDQNAAGLDLLATGLPHTNAIVGDAADPGTAAAATAAGAIDILVHTAAIDPLSATDVLGTCLNDWQTILSVNLTSAFLFARAVLPGMIEQGKGSLLFTGSISGLKPTPQEVAYSVSKAGVMQLMRAIALDHARQGIRSNALCPGFLQSVMSDRKKTMSPEELAARSVGAAALVPLGREGRYCEMATLALNLCDDSVSGYITGQSIVADGGMMLV